MRHATLLRALAFVGLTQGACGSDAADLDAAPVSESAHALSRTFIVNSNADARDAVPGDGVCRAANGACTLRAAVEEANASADPDTIHVPPGRFVLTPALGSLIIRQELTIEASPGRADRDGGGAILNRGGLVLVGCTIRQSTAPAFVIPPAPGLGGAIRNLGFYSSAKIRFSTLSDNSATRGGAVASEGGVLLVGSTVARNRAVSVRGFSGMGGGLYSTLGFRSDQSTFLANSAEQGGAIAAVDASTPVERFPSTMVNSTLSGNSASQEGGGLFLANHDAIDMSSSTITQNQAAVRSGGVHHASSGWLAVQNSIMRIGRPNAVFPTPLLCRPDLCVGECRVE